MSFQPTWPFIFFYVVSSLNGWVSEQALLSNSIHDLLFTAALMMILTVAYMLPSPFAMALNHLFATTCTTEAATMLKDGASMTMILLDDGLFIFCFCSSNTTRKKKTKTRKSEQ